MKHMDPLSTRNPSKNSSEYFNPPKKDLKVQFSVLNRAENASMVPYFHPYWCQWLQIAIPGYRKGSREDPPNLLPTGVFDPNRDENLKPLTPIGMKFWSH